MNDRLRRLLLVVPAARAQPGISLSELARNLACSAEELRDDIDLLACVGTPPFLPDDLIDIELREDDRVFVSIPLGFDRPTRLLASEAAALTMAVRALAPNDPLARSGVDKLGRAITPAQREWYDALVNSIVATPPDEPEDVEALLSQAIREHRTTELLYRAGTDLTTRTRVVRPRSILTVEGYRYLSAQKQDGQERPYRLDRIARATLRDDRFAELPPIDQDAFMARIADFQKQPELPRAMLRFDASVAHAARARYENARAMDDGRIEVELPYSTLPWLVSHVLSWGGSAEITAPPDAREALRHAVDRALAAHDTQVPTRKT